MNTLKSGSVYVDKYKENVFQCVNIDEINHSKIKKFSLR